jgi:arsenate reductase
MEPVQHFVHPRNDEQRPGQRRPPLGIWVYGGRASRRRRGFALIAAYANILRPGSGPKETVHGSRHLRLPPQRRPLADGRRVLQPADPSRAHAVSAGTAPGDRVHPEVAEVMSEAGIDLSGARPQLLTTELGAAGRLLVTMGCGEECPYLPGVAVEDWPLEDPKGRPVDRVREIRDEVKRRVAELVRSRGCARAPEHSRG